MMALRIITGLFALLLAVGELARWSGDPRLVPLAFDELIVAALMLGAALTPQRLRAVWMAMCWALFCGLTLSLLVPTLDHLLYGPPKESAGFYAIVLSVMLAIGTAAALWAASLAKAALR